MDISDAEFLTSKMDERADAPGPQGRYALQSALQQIKIVRGEVERVDVRTGTLLDAVDQCFSPTRTIVPSSMIRTHLRLAIQYLDDANGRTLIPAPTLSSYVLLRVAIESGATAYWLLSAKNRRQAVERALMRMWWDTYSAYEMAQSADDKIARTALDDLEQRIRAIAAPVKGVDADRILSSKRISLSSVVSEASSGLRPDYPGATIASWRLCAGISHGNLPISAGAGITAASILVPAEHPLDIEAYGHVLAMTVDDIQRVSALFDKRASTLLTHQRTPKSQV